jgi:uncharacterized DUF497 family protein
MLFEWDEAKSRRTYRERGFGFDYAAAIFNELTLERQDHRRDYGEVRMQAIGALATMSYSWSTPIAATSDTSFRHDAPIEGSGDYGTHSPNVG